MSPPNLPPSSHFFPPVSNFGSQVAQQAAETPFNPFSVSLPSFLQAPPGQHDTAWSHPDPALLFADSASEGSPNNLLWDMQASGPSIGHPPSMGHQTHGGTWQGHEQYGSLNHRPSSHGSGSLSTGGSGIGIGAGSQATSSMIIGGQPPRIASVEDILPWATVLAIVGLYHQHL
jgi:hypothetical protein